MVAMRWPISGLVVFALACDAKEGEAVCDPFAPDGLEVEFATELDDGRYFTVLKPREIESDDDYRAFFGPLDQMAEVDIVYFLREKDGGTTTIDLEIDGEAATAHIPVVWVGQDTEFGPSTFTIGDEVHDLEILARDPLVGAVYHCLP